MSVQWPGAPCQRPACVTGPLCSGRGAVVIPSADANHLQPLSPLSVQLKCQHLLCIIKLLY